MIATNHTTLLFETERLRLRKFTLDDAGFIIELLNSPGWLQYIGDRNIKTEEQAVAYLQNGPLKSYSKNGYGLSLVEKKDDGTPVGMCGIINRDNLDTPDIGFAFLPSYIGQGYGVEIASATLQYAQDVLGLPKVVAVVMAENTPSRRLLEKIGMQYVKNFSFPESKDELLLYSN